MSIFSSTVAPPRPALSAWTIAAAASASLAVVMGIGRFAFTPLLPMMIHDGTLNLAFGSTLASANYLGYLLGSLLCTVLPRHWSSATLTRWGLVLTILMTFAMLIHNEPAWVMLRFLAGLVSAMALVHTSRCCLAMLLPLGSVSLGSVMFTGVGGAITLSGLAVGGMVQLGWHSDLGWAIFGFLACVLTLMIWRIFGHDERPFTPAAHPATPAATVAGNPREMAVFAVAYGLAGFGYIITATFLPVIARATLPASASAWLDLFWPAFGIAAVVGSLMAVRLNHGQDARHALAVCYALEAIGVVGAMFVPTISGFFISSLLAGLPFTAINFFAMREVTRLRPQHAARYMGLLTALFSVGQIIGPPLVRILLEHARSQQAGFAQSLEIAAGALAIGAVMYLFMAWKWPVEKPPGMA